MNSRRRITVGVQLLASCALGVIGLGLHSGCGSSYPKCIVVGGKVTYHGKAVGAGSVCFVPVGKEGAKGLLRPASGDLQADGSYVMKTFQPSDGVLPGQYAVSIVAVDYHGAPQRNRDMESGTGKPDFRLPSTIPTKYASPQTSRLKATIPADASGSLRFDFDLID